METSSSLGASHLGNTNPNPVTSVQVDSVATTSEMIGNQITSIRTAVESTSNTTPALETTTFSMASPPSQRIGSSRAPILPEVVEVESNVNTTQSSTQPVSQEIGSKRERTSEGVTVDPKRTNNQGTPPNTFIMRQTENAMKAKGIELNRFGYKLALNQHKYIMEQNIIVTMPRIY